MFTVPQVDVDRDELPLGDYCWLLLKGQGSQGMGRGAATAAGGLAEGYDNEEEDGEGDDAAAAEERDRCVLAGAVVERKTIRDLVGRSAAG